MLCVGVAIGFGLSERLQQRDLLWRWLLDQSDRTIEDVAIRYGELWLERMRLNPDSADYEVLESRRLVQQKHLERLARMMALDKPGGNELPGECDQYPDWDRLQGFDPYLLPNLRSTSSEIETHVIFVNCTNIELSYHWVDGSGTLHYYGDVQPDAHVRQHTYDGHIWVVKNRRGGDLAVFRATMPMAVAIVESK